MEREIELLDFCRVNKIFYLKVQWQVFNLRVNNHVKWQGKQCVVQGILRRRGNSKFNNFKGVKSCKHKSLWACCLPFSCRF